MSGIFISYRRKDTAYIAGRLHDRLAEHFGPGQIFRDIETIKPGADFGQLIDEQVASCDAFLAVIGDNWLLDRNPSAKRPIGVPRDWVQREIEVALARPDVLVIPVLVENATVPSEQELPYSIRALAGRNAMELSDRRWDYEVQQLIEALEEVVQPERAASPAALGRGDAPSPAEVPDQTPLSARWAGRGAAASAPGSAGQTWEPRTVPLAEPSSRPDGPRIPTWLKVVVPVVILALLVIIPSAVLVGNLMGGAKGSDETTTTISASTTIPVVGPVTTLGVTAATTRPVTTVPPRVINGPFSGRSGAVTLTVQKLEAGADRVRVHLVIVNGTRDGLTFPAPSFSAVDNKGHPYKSDPFSPNWVDSVQPGGRPHTGIIDLVEPLQPGATSMRVGWSRVFGSFDIDSIFVDRVALR